MKTRPVGRTRLAVTELGFGGASLGNLYRPTDEGTGRAAVEAAYEAGIRYFDTAPHYGLGLSEERLGRALAGVPREDYVLSTKVGRLLDRNPNPTGSDLEVGGFDVPDTWIRRWDFSARGVRTSLERSLQRLGVDRVDIVYVHDPDDHVDQTIAEAVPALVELREQGIIGAVGVGMNQWEAPLRIVEETDVDVVMLAGRWTLLDRSSRPLLDACAARQVSVVAAAPYNSGLLARHRPEPGARFDYLPASDELLRRVHALADTCERWDVTLPDAAVQHPLRHPAVVSVVAGLRAPAQVRQFVERYATTVPADAWPELDR
ncbi:aldo/keto reductase [Nitriliruptor alkaliphilus]|uniref:aldo/keto reductase n=1 Tax=Nitriliruptor alkaliphilus TaxID=427918 RepID=UPI0006973F48|nr:aldo/keto reductase [Nitriliruptor alkaliphilus]